MIMRVESDLMKVPLDIADDDRDMPSWDLGTKPPSYGYVERQIRGENL